MIRTEKNQGSQERSKLWEKHCQLYRRQLDRWKQRRMTCLFSVMARNRSLEGLSGIISMKFKGKRYIREEDWKNTHQTRLQTAHSLLLSE